MPGTNVDNEGDEDEDQAGAVARKRRKKGSLPDKESVLSETTLISPKGNRYQILRTDERDAYDPPESSDKPKDVAP